jgi:Dihydrodipicolinate synthetase family
MITQGRGNRDPSPGQQRRGSIPLTCRAQSSYQDHERNLRREWVQRHRRNSWNRNTVHQRNKEVERGCEGSWSCFRTCPHTFYLGCSNDQGRHYPVPSRCKFLSFSYSSHDEFEVDFGKVADASPIPVMLYNFPRITAGIDLDSDMILTLAQHPNIVSVKLTCANMGKLHRITSTIPSSEFAVFGGKSDILLQGLSLHLVQCRI